MIISKTGLPGKWMGVDENMEHGINKVWSFWWLTHGCNIQIVYPKTLFAAKGLHASWDRLANISASIDILDQVQWNIAISLEAPYSGTTHTTLNTSGVVWAVANKARELKLNTFHADREGNDNIKPKVDTLATGERLLKSSTLATFNKKRRDLCLGILVEDSDDVDDIPALDLEVCNDIDE